MAYCIFNATDSLSQLKISCSIAGRNFRGGGRGNRGRGRGRGRGGGGFQKTPVPTANELDADLDAYKGVRHLYSTHIVNLYLCVCVIYALLYVYIIP